MNLEWFKKYRLIDIVEEGFSISKIYNVKGGQFYGYTVSWIVSNEFSSGLNHNSGGTCTTKIGVNKHGDIFVFGDLFGSDYGIHLNLSEGSTPYLIKDLEIINNRYTSNGYILDLKYAPKEYTE